MKTIIYPFIKLKTMFIYVLAKALYNTKYILSPKLNYYKIGIKIILPVRVGVRISKASITLL